MPVAFLPFRHRSCQSRCLKGSPVNFLIMHWTPNAILQQFIKNTLVFKTEVSFRLHWIMLRWHRTPHSQWCDIGTLWLGQSPLWVWVPVRVPAPLGCGSGFQATCLDLGHLCVNMCTQHHQRRRREKWRDSISKDSSLLEEHVVWSFALL